MPRVHAAYEQALMEMAESMFISRNIVVALLALHSWKSFVSHWMQAVVTLLDTKESSKLNKPLKAANDIFKVRKYVFSYSFILWMSLFEKTFFRTCHRCYQGIASLDAGVLMQTKRT